MRKENYKKWILEGATYRAGDILIALGIGFSISLFVTHDFGDSLEIGSAVSLIENSLNTAFYFLNRWFWSKSKYEEVKI